MPKKKKKPRGEGDVIARGNWSPVSLFGLLICIHTHPNFSFFLTVLTLSNNRCSIGNFSQPTSILPIFHWSCIYFWKKKRNHPRELSWGAAESGGPWAAAMRRLARWTRDKASNSICETRKWTLTRPWTPSTISESGIVLSIFLICCL